MNRSSLKIAIAVLTIGLLAGFYFTRPNHAIEAGRLSITLPDILGSARKTTASVDGKTVTKFEAQNSLEKITLEMVSPIEREIAETQMRIELALIQSSHAAQPSPYPGVLTSSGFCDKSLAPAINIIGSATHLSTGTNEGHSFAFCDASRATHSADLFFSYQSKEKALLKISLFLLKQNEQIRKSFVEQILSEINKP